MRNGECGIVNAVVPPLLFQHSAFRIRRDRPATQTTYGPQHFLNFRPLPQGQGSLRHTRRGVSIRDGP